MKVIVIGATGATGRELLELLLRDVSISAILVFSRRELNVEHEKLNVEVVDFGKMSEWADKVKGDVLFSCLGTTLSVAGSKQAQWLVDYTYQYEVARIASLQGVRHYVLVSSVNADAKSRFFYMHMKGKLEDAIRGLVFETIQIYRPPMLLRPSTDRWGEKIGAKLIAFLNVVGLFRGIKPMPTRFLAQVMLQEMKRAVKGISLYTPADIWRIAQ